MSSGVACIKGTSIPKVIYMCYKHKRIPPKVIHNWQRLNPDFKVFLFDDRDCFRFLAEHFGKQFAVMFKGIPDGAIKADFWRVCVLHKMGGVYADVDIDPKIGIESFVESGVDFLTCNSMWREPNSLGPLNPHLIMAPPGSPLLKSCIARYLHLFKAKLYGYWLWSVTHVLGSVLDDATSGTSKSEVLSVLTSNTGLKIQLLRESGPSGEIIKGDSPLVGCYYGGREVLRNRYADYGKWSVRTESETHRRNGTHVGIKGLGPLRKVAVSQWTSSSFRRF